jgi:hypothetical protein
MSTLSAAPGGGRPNGEHLGSLRAWLYEVSSDGTSHLMGPSTGWPTATIEPNCTLRVSVEGGQNTPTMKFLKAPPAEGMSTDPVTVEMNSHGFWMIRNSGRTNTLRVQQYGLSAGLLRPRTSMPMAGRDVAVWIPVVPRGPSTGKSESFRLLILAAPAAESQDNVGPTKFITAPRRYLSEAKQEALIAYFGDHLSWPPLPAPHVRQQAEVERIAELNGLTKAPDRERWARNRFDVLAGRDGLFRDADWYSPLGGPDRTLANYLTAFHRLVELRTITLRRVCEWAARHDVRPYTLIDRRLVPDS